MTLFPQEQFEDAAEAEIVTKLSDIELAITSVVERHGELPDGDIERLAQRLDEYCADLVINAMFTEQPSYAQFLAREEEFEAACRQKFLEYGMGKFDLPPVSRGNEPEVKPVP